jgi:hypothetical protein
MVIGYLINPWNKYRNMYDIFISKLEISKFLKNNKIVLKEN